MKKTAIITVPLYTNYGGIIQAWALQRILKKYDIESEIISPYFIKHISFLQKSYSDEN